MSVGGENADWSYARREAVVARLNGKDVNLDALKDDDLNQLYSSILKVRHSRTSSVATSVASGDRPESRMSFLDSVTEDGDDEEGSSIEAGSRPYSGGTWTTDPTSAGDSTMTLANLPDLYEKPFGIEGFDNFNQHDRLPSSISTPPSISIEDNDQVVSEKKAMEEKLKKLEKKMATQRKRLEKIRKSTPGSAGTQFDDFFDDEYPPLAPEAVELAKKVVEKWRRRRRVRMAEDALSQAVLLKEANVLSRELKKGVSVQFAVIEDTVPKSALAQLPGLEDIEEETDPSLVSCAKPCIGIKVLDRRHQSVALWSLDKLRQRLESMRNLYKWIDKPQYSQHFSLEDPFYDPFSTSGGFSFVGSSLVSLVPLLRNLPSTQTVQISSPYIADPIGSCRVDIAILSSSPPSHNTLNGETSLIQGGSVEVEVKIDQVQGLTKSEFASAHIQLATSSFFYVELPKQDKTAISEEVDLFKSSPSSLTLARTFRIDLTPSTLDHFQNDHARIDFFARPRLPHLDKIERWDEARDGSSSSKQLNAPPVRGGDPLNDDVTRRPENDFILEQQHDVLAAIEIRELGEKGEYVPVPVVSSNPLDGGAFFLRQGLQRRLVLNLSHNSGRAFEWKRVSKVSLGNVRMFDNRGRIHAATSAADAELRGMGHPRPQFASDGTSTLSFAAAWDSSVHDSPHLNCNTQSGARALIRLSFDIEAGGVAGPITFSQDIAVTVSSRDSRPPNKLLNMLTSTRLSSRISSVFSIRLSPFSTRKPGDLWRLDTSETYVRGEETLAGWKPRGLTLVRDYDSSWTSKLKLADVEATRAILSAIDVTLPTVEDLPREDRLRQVLELWQRQFGSREEVSFLLLLYH